MKLGNPVIVEAVKAQAGQKAVEKATEIIPFVLKTVFILGILGFAYYKFINRFEPLKENPDYPNASYNRRHNSYGCCLCLQSPRFHPPLRFGRLR